MSIQEIESRVQELQELKRLREELEAEIGAIEDEIKAHMGEQEQLTAGAFKITWRSITSCRVDTTALKKDHADLVAAYTKTLTTRRFCVV